jgi:hypothetical protein
MFEAKKAMTQVCRCLLFLFLSFFVVNKAMTTSLLPSQNFPLLPTSPLLPTYLTSFCVHPIVRARENLKRESRSGNQEKTLKRKSKSGRAKARTKNEKAKQELEGSLPSFGFILLLSCMFCPLWV